MPNAKAKVTLVLDGQKQRPEDFERGVKMASLFFAPPSESPNTVIAFSSDARFRTWARSQEVLEHFERGRELVSKAKKPTAALERELERLQRARVMAETKRVDAELKLRGIDFRTITPAQLRTLERLSVGAEIYGGPVIGSAWIFDGIGQNGTHRKLTTGLLYPKFSWFDFNDRAESGVATWPQVCMLYQHTWYKGSTFAFSGPQTQFYWFNNRASSGWVA